MVCFERSFQFTFLTYYNKKSGDKRVYIKDFPLFSCIFEQKKHHATTIVARCKRISMRKSYRLLNRARK